MILCYGVLYSFYVNFKLKPPPEMETLFDIVTDYRK